MFEIDVHKLQNSKILGNWIDSLSEFVINKVIFLNTDKFRDTQADTLYQRLL